MVACIQYTMITIHLSTTSALPLHKKVAGLFAKVVVSHNILPNMRLCFFTLSVAVLVCATGWFATLHHPVVTVRLTSLAASGSPLRNVLSNAL